MKILNDKNRAFCEEYVNNGYKAWLAYSKVYNQEDMASASVWASQLLKQQRIRDYIDLVEGNFKLLGQKEGLDKTVLIKAIKEMLFATKKDLKWVESPDWSARNNAINTFAKLAWFDIEKTTKGWLVDDDADDKKDVSISEMTDEEKKIYREKLLSEL
jgi:hypothetical protein